MGMKSASYATTMHEKDITILDFDSAVALAIKDPEAFEAYRLKVIEVLIERAPERTQLHLRRLQWRIKQVRRSPPNPFEACLKLQKMMWHSVAGQGELTESVNNPHNSAHRLNSTLPKARVLKFSSTEDIDNDSDQ